MKRGGYDDRTDFTHLKMDDSQLARMLQDEERNPVRSKIEDKIAPAPVFNPSSYELDYVKAQKRNLENQLQTERSKKNVYIQQPIYYTFDNIYDRIYKWSIGLLPDYDYIRRLRLQHMIEKLIRDRLELGEPEYLLKEEIRRLIERSEPQPKKKSAKKKKKSKSRSKRTKN